MQTPDAGISALMSAELLLSEGLGLSFDVEGAEKWFGSNI